MPDKNAEEYDLNVHGLTQSVLTMWRECPTKARLYLDSWSPEKKASIPLIWGHDFHKSLELSFTELRDMNPNGSIDVAGFNENIVKPVLDNMWLDDERVAEALLAPSEHEYSAGLTEIFAPRFFQEYENVFLNQDGFSYRKMICLEEEFCEDIFEVGIPFRGKIDGIVEDKSGNLWILEHKTKSRFSAEALLATIPRDLQVSVYMTYVKRKYGKLPVGVVYNVIRRPELRQKSSENMLAFLNRIQADVDERRDHYFQMLEIYISPSDYEYNLVKIVDELKAFRAWVRKERKLDHQHTNNCQTTYGMCQYLGCCNSHLTDYSMLKVRDRIFPELDMMGGNE